MHLSAQYPQASHYAAIFAGSIASVTSVRDKIGVSSSKQHSKPEPEATQLTKSASHGTSNAKDLDQFRPQQKNATEHPWDIY